MGPIVASSSAFIRTTSLPWANASSSDVRTELDRAGRLDQDVDCVAPAEQRRVLGRDRAAARRRVECSGRVHRDRLGVGVADDVSPHARVAVRRRRPAHAGDAVHDLVREALAP